MTVERPHEDRLGSGGSTTTEVLKRTGTGTAEWTEPAASGAPTTADYLVATAQAGLSAEIVVGATPGGELGGTWGSPTVDATHSGSTHTDFIAKAIVDAKGDLIAATAADTVARVAVGTDGLFLKADSGASAGVSWAAPAGGGGGPSAIAYSSGDVTVTGSLADITGCSVSLTAGTYIVTGVFDVLVNNALNDRVFEGHLDSGGADQTNFGNLVAPGLVNVRAMITQKWRLVLASTTTVKLRAKYSGGTVGDFTVKAQTSIAAFGAGTSVASDGIWDAAGDLAVGTGADTAARLAIGAAGTLLQSNGTTAAWAAPAANMWSMSLSASQTLTNNTVTTITWDRTDIDGGSSVIDLANDRFVAPATGFYMVLFSWLWETTVPLANATAMQINVNGTNQALLRVPGATAATAVYEANRGYNGAASLSLTAGDLVTGAINPGAVTGVTARGNAARALSTVITLVRIT